jgi:hypothetical protein
MHLRIISITTTYGGSETGNYNLSPIANMNFKKIESKIIRNLRLQTCKYS